MWVKLDLHVLEEKKDYVVYIIGVKILIPKLLGICLFGRP